jgi:hypothetical protein
MQANRATNKAACRSLTQTYLHTNQHQPPDKRLFYVHPYQIVIFMITFGIILHEQIFQDNY